MLSTLDKDIEETQRVRQGILNAVTQPLITDTPSPRNERHKGVLERDKILAEKLRQLSIRIKAQHGRAEVLRSGVSDHTIVDSCKDRYDDTNDSCKALQRQRSHRRPGLNSPRRDRQTSHLC